MITYGNSGCFGSPESEHIGDIDDTVEVIDDILTGEPAGGSSEAVADAETVECFGKSMLVLGEYLKRVRILTWAVIALAVVVIMREVKE